MATLLTVMYALVQMMVLVALMISMSREGIGSPTFIFFAYVAGTFLLAAVLHPQVRQHWLNIQEVHGERFTNSQIWTVWMGIGLSSDVIHNYRKTLQANITNSIFCPITIQENVCRIGNKISYHIHTLII